MVVCCLEKLLRCYADDAGKVTDFLRLGSRAPVTQMYCFYVTLRARKTLSFWARTHPSTKLDAIDAVYDDDDDHGRQD